MPAPRGVGISLNFSTLDGFGGDVDALAKQAKEKGANIVSGPLARPWNVRELTIPDPHGYQPVFTTPLNTNLRFDEVVKRVASGE